MQYNGSVYYPTLDILVRDPLYKVVYSGPVRSVREYVSKRFPRLAEGMDRAIGAHVVKPTSDGHEHHIIHEQQDRPYETLYADGHEQGHSARAAEWQRTGLSTGPISQLEQKLAKLNVKIDLSKYRQKGQMSTEDEETFANICGLYALHRANYDVAKYGKLVLKKYNAPQMAEALDIYLDGMRKGAQMSSPQPQTAPRYELAPAKNSFFAQLMSYFFGRRPKPQQIVWARS